MLAYVFWHRPAVAAEHYEARLDAFHDVIGVESRWFRIPGVPWMPDGGYEDWYLVGDWTALGALNEQAVDAARRGFHDAAAASAGFGIAGVYALRRGAPDLAIIAFAAWRSKPPGATYDRFEPTLPGRSVWQRQMTLGPTPEYVSLDVTQLDGDPAVAYR